MSAEATSSDNSISRQGGITLKLAHGGHGHMRLRQLGPICLKMRQSPAEDMSIDINCTRYTWARTGYQDTET
ncbi:hypothetical protein COL516b_010113 [Colletotrichum fioriniae]|nr:uncharacterized protein COL516b_010113 [Colletotrichum fioriniae]KAJ0298190.1 hypothetical protein COL516b_010113 [Colletotrichum fioriniae]